MFAESRKLHIIEAVLKTMDESVLNAIEMIVDRDIVAENAKGKFIDLLGTLTAEEAETMKKTIEENFEKINPYS
jgi:hypothetical protein